MTPAQSAAFAAAKSAAFAAANGGHTPSDVSTLVASMFVVLVLIWAAWLMARTLSALYKGNAREIDLLWVGLRASAVIAIAIWWVNT